ncbi:hypothetical protein Cgig2_027680 [Carnegiea gigantea]|uniref:Uncharacterized protein n=1 Tax=Carnegiea gigantea TaxID=171969 RepID=A0A9Q1GH18_9CARY|nr:hypothetical protein Cgig2_027680 [Carnegiea gigantea]
MELHSCNENEDENNNGLRIRLFMWMVLSKLFFPRMPYGAVWCMERYADDVQCLGEYALVEFLGPANEVQLNRCVILLQVWFYEHTRRFSSHAKRRFPRIAKWDAVDHKGHYDAYALLARLKEKEVIPVLYPKEEEKEQQIVKDFLDTDGWRYYLEGDIMHEWVLSYGELLQRALDELRLEKEKRKSVQTEVDKLAIRVHDLEARLRKYKDIPDYFQVSGAQPPVDGDGGLWQRLMMFIVQMT